MMVSLAEILDGWTLEFGFEPSLDYVMKDVLTPQEERLPVRFVPAK
jgi:hypothetical protein